MFGRFRDIYNQFPKKFWTVVAVMFIDRVGSTMLFPFFSLYITKKFSVGMTEAGIVLMIFSGFGMIGSMAGGALTDKFGRRILIIFGLVFSALSTLSLAFANSISTIYGLAIMVGLLSNVSGPAHQAMIADILEEKQRAEGFGILRVIANMAWIIGPTVGGFVATRSYFALFVIDATVSCFVALLFFLLISETKPDSPDDNKQKDQGILESLKGYGTVLSDAAFMAFIVAATLMGSVYIQMYNTLSVFLETHHQIPAQGYGFLLTTSAITVILLQLWITRRIKKLSPFLMMGLGTLFYMVGFSMYGFNSVLKFDIPLAIGGWSGNWTGQYSWFLLAIIIITIGEMVIMPVSQTLAANFAPEDKRGRYMAIFGLCWALPATFAPLAAGIILDNLDPNLLWRGGGCLCALTALVFYVLHQHIGKQKRFSPAAQEEKLLAKTA
ncbi:MAG: MFS transporter [Anaerolineales bacterium]|nr:MFS transporter [Anaerolineales bacterium]